MIVMEVVALVATITSSCRHFLHTYMSSGTAVVSDLRVF